MHYRLAYLLVTACFFVMPALRAADAPQWRGPDRTGQYADTNLLKAWPEGGPKRLWQRDNLGEGFASMAIVGDIVYTTGLVEGRLVLYSLSAKDGAERWHADVDAAFTKQYPGSRATPTVDGDRIYVLGGQGMLVCFAAADGKRLWEQSMLKLGGRVPGWGYSESVLIDGDLAIATPGGSTAIVAFDKRTGEVVWKSSGFSAPVHYSSCIAIELDGVRMIVNGTGAGLVGVSAKDGSLLWSNDFGARNTANCPTPAYADGIVFWSVGYGKGCVAVKLAVADGKVTATELYRNQNMVSHHGGFVILGKYVYGNHNGGWTCLELATGEKVWFEKGVGKGSLIGADGMLYTFGEGGGRIALVEATPEGYRAHGQFSVAGRGPSWAYPAIANGRLYLRYAGNLYCYDIKR